MQFNVAIYASLFCAIVMIVGGIWLLAKGLIKLSEAGKAEGALSVELFNKIKLSTGYPALAFFVIGLILIGLAIWFSKPADVVSVVFLGKLKFDNATVVTGKVVPVNEVGATFQPDSSGAIETLHPDVRFEVQMVAPGYQP